MLLVSVIIPAYNSEETLAQSLHALESQTISCKEYEVIVVDDGSTDATANLVASFRWVHCVSIPHSGAATARNRGATAARGEILMFTDADCEPQSDWMEKMLAPFADTSVIGAKGVYRTRAQGMTARFVQLEYEEKYERMRSADQIDFIDTYSAAYRRQVFLTNGGFDESFPTASVEDQEFSFRLARLGCRMVFIPDAIVFHPHDSSLGAYLRRKFFIGYWKVHLHTRHPTKVWRDSHTPPTLKLQILFLLATLASIAASPIIPQIWLMAMAFALAFSLSALPLVVFIARRDRMIALIAPAMILARALGLTAGLIIGVVGETLRGICRGRIR